MKSYYNILDKLRNHFESDDLVNSITTGDIFQVDLEKQTIFPYVHIMVNNAQFIDSTVVFNVSLICMDIVDKSKKEATDKFITNDNEQDVLNTTLAILNRVYDVMRRGSLFDNLIQVQGTPNCEPFTERFENNLAGWTMSFDLVTNTNMTIC